MERLRVLVMNGQRLLESQTGAKWHTEKVQPAGDLKPGIYNIFTAKAPAPDGTYNGQIIHVDAKTNAVYQEIAKNSYVQHTTSSLNAAVEIGQKVSIAYKQGAGEVSANTVTQSRGIRM